MHITTYQAWVQAQQRGHYQTPSLQQEGFIHCSTPRQTLGVANSMFHGERGLVLLCIDEDKVASAISYEDCYETGQEFPHIYGPLNLEAVVRVVPFTPDADGKFALPDTFVEPSLRCNYPILEFDPGQEALIEPSQVLRPIDIPRRCVLCFFQDVIASLKEKESLRLLHNLGSEIGHNPVYEIEVDGRRLALCHPGVGAPLAAAFMDELIALGCRRFIICGGAGALNSALALGHVVVPTSAVRDEGTSYHYLPPAREVSPTADAVAAVEKVLQRAGVDYVAGKTWTTDGVYRETVGKIQLRRAEGCLTVEMEAAAFFAVAHFRGVAVAQILYGGDDLGSDAWDSRHWQRQAGVREKLFWLAAESCLEL
jgi:uncharacterized protein (DUF952 family)/uridine phosphorylase